MPARPLLGGLLVVFVAQALPAQSTLLRRLIEGGRHPAIHWGRFPDVQAEARSLYSRHDWVPLWMAQGRPTAEAHALLDALATAGDRGLNPEDYDAAQLAALAAMLDRRGADAEQAVRFDAALTVAALRVVHALAQGRLGARQARLGFGLTRAAFSAEAAVARLRATTEPGPLLSALEPQWPQYVLLKRALLQYRALARDSAAWRLPRPGRTGIAEGGRYSGADRLRRVLGALGDLAPAAAASRPGDSVLTTELVDGLRSFEARELIPVTGLLDQTTWSALTHHFAGRLRQLALALERWRWLPRELQEVRPVFISLPALRIHYGLPTPAGEFSPAAMRVLLGDGFPVERPVLAGALTLLRFGSTDPYETGVDFALEGNPGFSLSGLIPGAPPPSALTRNAIVVVDGALLARLLLADRPEWTSGRIQAAMAGHKPAFVRLHRRIPVLVVYATAVARENGQVFFYQDRRGEDRRLQAQLAAGYPYGER